MKQALTDELKHELTESEAIRLARGGDAAAFEYLYRAHCKRVYSICLRMLRNASDAEDLTQQIFLRVFRKIGTFRGDSGFSTWLYRVAVNAVLMHLRRKKPDEIHPDSASPAAANLDAPHEFAPTDTSMLGAIERLNLMRAIRRLPAGYKRLLLLHDVMGYMHSEICASRWMLDRLFKIAGAQGSQTAAAPGVWGTRTSRARCRLRRTAEALCNIVHKARP